MRRLSLSFGMYLSIVILSASLFFAPHAYGDAAQNDISAAPVDIKTLRTEMESLRTEMDELIKAQEELLKELESIKVIARRF